MNVRIPKAALILTGLAVTIGRAPAVAQTAAEIQGQGTAPDSALGDRTVGEGPAMGLPVFATLGFGFGSRSDECVLCESPEDNESFSAHLSVGRPLAAGVGVGLEVSVWKRGRPGLPGPADESGEPTTTPVANTLGNASIAFSYQVWHLYARAGAGLAWASQSLVVPGEDGDPALASWSGKGVGYTVGGGVTVPLHPMMSLAFYANWNLGTYDMSEAQGAVHRDVRHEYVEIGVGVSLR